MQNPESFSSVSKSMNFTLDPKRDSNGSHNIGYFEISPAQLVRVFGKPQPADEYKVSGEYKFIDEGFRLYKIYDYKKTSLFEEGYITPEEFWKLETPQSFSLGGFEASDVNAFKEWLGTIARIEFLTIVKPKPLYKTTIVIWTDFDPSESEIAGLAQEATDGTAYCSVQKSEKIDDPTKDPDWDGTEFFEEEL